MYIDVKFTGWKRFYFPKDIKIPNFSSEDEVNEFINDNMTECEALYDTEEDMLVTENSDNSTIEVYDDCDDMIWYNGNQ